MLQLIEAAHPGFSGAVLDIGCATGVLLEQLNDRFPGARCTGIDASAELIRRGRESLATRDIVLHVADAGVYEPDQAYDIVVASGVLSIWEDFAEPLERWLTWLAPAGALYLFNRFNSAPIDTIVRFRNHFTGGDWEGGLTSYSIATVRRWLEQRGYSAEFTRFHLPITLPRQPDPIRTYTVACDDGTQLVLNGANVLAEHHFAIIRRVEP